MKKRKLIIKIVGKTQRKMDPLKVAKALGASRMGKVNFPYYYAPQNMGKLINLVKNRLKKLKKAKKAKRKNR